MSRRLACPTLLVAWCAALGLVPGGIRAAEPSLGPAPFSAWVPADVGLCLEIRDLARHARRFCEGELYRRLQHYPPLEKWIAEHGPELAKLSGQLRQRLGVSPEEVWTQLLGRQVLVGVWPPEPGAADGPVLLLVDSADTELLDRLLDRLLALQHEAGRERETRPLELAGRTYPVHVIQTGPDESRLYLAILDNVGLMATSDEVLKNVLALRAGVRDPQSSLAALPAYLHGVARLAPDAAVRLFVNPRPWDERMLAGLKAKRASAGETQAQACVVETWRAAEYGVLALEVGAGLALEGFVKWDPNALPEVVRLAVGSAAGRARFLEHVPSNAVAAWAGRIDLGSLLWRLATSPPSAPPDDSGEPTSFTPEVSAGWVALVTLARGLGPDFATYVAPAGGAPETDIVEQPEPEIALKVDWVVGLDTRPLKPGENQPAMAEILHPLLETALGVAAATANAQTGEPRVAVETVDVEGLTMTSIEGLGPFGKGMAATFAVIGGRIWGGTSRGAVSRAARLRAAESLAHSPAFRERLSPRVPEPSHLVYIDLSAARRLIEESPGALEYLSAAKGLDRDTAQQSRRELVAILKLADSALLAARVDEAELAVSASLSAREAGAE